MIGSFEPMRCIVLVDMAYQITVLCDVLCGPKRIAFVIEFTCQRVTATYRIVAVKVVTGPPLAIKSVGTFFISYVLFKHNMVCSIDFFTDIWVLCVDRRVHISI